MKSKTKHACIVEADESPRIRLEGAPHRYHEDHIAAERNEFTQSLQFSAQVYSNASSIKKYQIQKDAMEKEWKNLEKILA